MSDPIADIPNPVDAGGGRESGAALSVATRRTLDRAFPALLTVLGILFFWDPLFSGKNFFFRDILNFHYPLRRILIESYARGEFPLWNPYIYLGQPMLANPNYMAFYPTNLLHLLFPFDYAFKLHFILHPILGGIGLYCLQRRLGIRPISALAGSVAYQFSGTVLSFLNLYNLVPAVALLPWIGWAFLGVLSNRNPRRTVGLGALLAFQVIAFEPLLFACNLLFLTMLAVWWIWRSADRRASFTDAGIGLGYGLGFAAGLSALQVVPTLELLPRSARSAAVDFEMAGTWSMHPVDFLSTLIPNLFGNPYTIGHATEWGEAFHNNVEAYLVSFFLGSSVILLVLLSLRSERKKLTAVLFGTVGVGVFLSLGRFNPAYRWLYDHLPILGLGRYPSKYFLLVSMALSMLAALGLEALLDRTCHRPGATRARLPAGLFGMAGAAVLFGLWALWGTDPESLAGLLRSVTPPERAAAKDFVGLAAMLRQSILASAAFLSVTGALVLTASRWRPSQLGGMMVLIVAVELIPANLRLSPLISDADVDLVPEVNAYLQGLTSGAASRVLSPAMLRPLPGVRLEAPNPSVAWLSLFYRMSGQPADGIMQGIEYSLVHSVDYLNTMESQQLYRACYRMPEADRLQLMKKLNTPWILSLGPLAHPESRRIAAFDTRSDHPVELYRLDGTLPRAWFVPNALVVASRDQALQTFLSPEFDFRRSVVLEGPAPGNPAGAGSGNPVTIRSYEGSRILCEVDAAVPGYLLLLDSYYPGWNAYIDGSAAVVRRANYAFRAVEVTPGRHRVEFVYRPWSVGLGLISTGLTAVVALVYAFRRRSPQAPLRTGAGT